MYALVLHGFMFHTHHKPIPTKVISAVKVSMCYIYYTTETIKLISLQCSI